VHERDSVTKLWVAEWQAGNYVYVGMDGDERQHVTVQQFLKVFWHVQASIQISAIQSDEIYVHSPTSS